MVTKTNQYQIFSWQKAKERAISQKIEMEIIKATHPEVHVEFAQKHPTWIGEKDPQHTKLKSDIREKMLTAQSDFEKRKVKTLGRN
jgi:hypothetical protein